MPPRARRSPAPVDACARRVEDRPGRGEVGCNPPERDRGQKTELLRNAIERRVAGRRLRLRPVDELGRQSEHSSTSPIHPQAYPIAPLACSSHRPIRNIDTGNTIEPVAPRASRVTAASTETLPPWLLKSTNSPKPDRTTLAATSRTKRTSASPARASTVPARSPRARRCARMRAAARSRTAPTGRGARPPE